jgi:predicted amidohydrolase YtcJ
MNRVRHFSCALCLASFLTLAGVLGDEADLILYHGKIVTVDRLFSTRDAMAVKAGRILQVGSNADILKFKGARTESLDLDGKMVLPGLIDSHTHPGSAAMTEFDHVIPEMESIQDVLDYIKRRADVLPNDQWIEVRQVFITRLREQRYPTRADLDRAAPNHPVVFSTGPDASLNGRALQLCGIDSSFRIPDGVPGRVEKDAQGEPTGILRTYANYAKAVKSSGKKPREEDYLDRLRQLFHDYNSVGLTSVADRSADIANIERYQKLLASGELTVRMSISHHVATAGPIEEIQERIREVAKHPLCKGDSMLRIIGIKTFLDGGMLTGSAYMREPWGVSDVYAITDPDYRGVLFIPKERLLPIVRTTVESGLQFTAHSVGDSAVHTLLDVYEEINRSKPIRSTRPCITHCNFMSREAVEKAASLGVVIDMQPAWLYLDTRTLVKQFGYDRLRYFQPLQSIFKAGGIVGGGSDHMQKVGSLRAINPYNPFLAMWTTITRKARWFDGVLHPEEALTREQAIRFYTANNAWLLFKEGEIGSLEAGKLADFIVADRDLLTCPVDDIRDTQVLRTYLNGKLVFKRE